MSHSYTAGACLENRDGSWRMTCINRTTDVDELLICEGLSELVRGRQASFQTQTESKVRVLASEIIVLIHYTSSSYSASRSYLATLIHQAPSIDKTIYFGLHAVRDVMASQLKSACSVVSEESVEGILLTEFSGQQRDVTVQLCAKAA